MPGLHARPHTAAALFARIALLVLSFHAVLPVQAGAWQNNLGIGGFTAVHVYTPDTVSPIGNGRALLIVLHGCTQPIGAYLTARLEHAAENHGMVIAVPDAMNKAGFACWSYWQGAIDRNAGDYRNLIQLAQALTADASRAIDPDQIYIAGLSSGATFAAQTTCLAPDVFAGVASSAGPSIGTSSGGAIGHCETVSPSLFDSRCRSAAGSAFQSYFDTQSAVIAHGTGDSTVHSCYNEQNARGFARVYGVDAVPGSVTIIEGTRSAEEFLWQDRRVAMLWLNGLGHAWSGGAGASGSFIGAQSIHFADYLGGHFASANRRVNRNQPPSIDALSAMAIDDRLHIAGDASDADGDVVSVHAAVMRIAPADGLVELIDTTVDGNGGFSVFSRPLADGLYEISVHAIDDQGLGGPTVSASARIGDPPPPQPPVLSDIAVTVTGQCATVSGVVIDPNQDLDSVQIQFASATAIVAVIDALIEAPVYAGTRCALPGGHVVATVTAIDASGLHASDEIAFVIDAGQTGDLHVHLERGHITWGSGYAPCYLAFGTAAFTMRESPTTGGQCIWTADAAGACQGPAQACSLPPPDNDPEPEPAPCTQHTTMNYLHRAAGRAYSSGLLWAPDYHAVGSGDAMPGSTYGMTTLSSSDGGHWSVAACAD